MRFKRRKRNEAQAWLTVAGVTLAGAAAAYGVIQILKSGPVSRRRDMMQLERNVLQALLEDEVATNQGIDIAAVGVGVVELSGSCETGSAARHIVELVDRLPGVRAVVNRMEILDDESRLRRNRARTSAGGTRWYGGSVGIGKRRQGIQTDPPRRDDSTAILTRSMRPNRDDALTAVEEAEGPGVRIGVSRAGPFTTDVPPRSPDARTDRPGAPPPAER